MNIFIMLSYNKCYRWITGNTGTLDDKCREARGGRSTRLQYTDDWPGSSYSYLLCIEPKVPA